MKITKIIVIVLVTISCFLFTFFNCVQLDEVTVPEEINQGVTGFVTIGLGGEARNGATVEARLRDGTVVKSVKTDASGYYSMALDAGIYDIVVLGETIGFASSRYQDVLVNGNTITKTNIVQPIAQRSGYSLEAPWIEVTGISSGQNVEGIMRVTATGHGSNPIEGLYWTRYNGIWLTIGNTARMWDAASRSDTLVYDWNVDNAPPGKTTLHFVTMDVNLNRCEIVIDAFTGLDASVIPPSHAPGNASAVAYTFNGNRCLYTSRREATINRLGIDKDPYVSVVAGKSYDLKSIPPNTRSNIDVKWDRVPGCKGYNIYRSPTNDLDVNPSGYEFLGSTVGEDYTSFPDFSADLCINALYSYQVRAYNRGGEGPPYVTCPVKLLPSYSLWLDSPGSDSLMDNPHENPELVLRQPDPVKFNWRVSDIIPGADRYDQIYCFNVNVSYLSLTWGLLEDVTFINQTSALYQGNESFKNYQTYEWDIFDSVYRHVAAMEYTIYGPNNENPQTISCGGESLSYPQMGRTTFGYSSNNGAYYFYTDFGEGF